MIRPNFLGVAGYLFALAGALLLLASVESGNAFVLACGVAELLGGVVLVWEGRRHG